MDFPNIQNRTKKFLSIVLIVALTALWLMVGGQAAVYAAPAVPVSFTILHTNDFHGQLQPSGSNPGAASVAYAVQEVRDAVGADKVLLVDAGDSMQGSLLSNIQQGYPVVAVFNAMDYVSTTVGNHDFDWGPTGLANRIAQATYPFLSANIVSGDPDGWTPAPGITPYIIETVGSAPNEVKVAFIGVTTQETADLNPTQTAGLTFKDPADAIIHYYDTIAALADVIVVVSHLGFNDGGYGYGFSVYGDKTLAQMLIDAGKPVDLILGGHSHTDMAAATVIGDTTVAQAYYSGRRVGRAEVTVNTDGSVDIVWSRIIVDPLTKNPAIEALVNGFASDPAYLALINTPIAYTNVPITRNYNGDSLMGAFIDDALYGYLNTDAEALNDCDIVFTNAGSLRADITSGAYPALITYGMMFTVLPFGNQLVVGSMTGAEIQELLDQSASLFKGALQLSGARYEFYNYVDAEPGPQPFASGAFNIKVWDKTASEYKPLDPAKTYRVATNEFLAPAGGDGFTAFQGMTDITYWSDMLNLINVQLMNDYPLASPFSGILDGRIAWDGFDASLILGQTLVPLDALGGFTSETNAGNLAADAAMAMLDDAEIMADFYLGGAIRNTRIADLATPGTPADLTVRDLNTLMPGDDNLVVLLMNGQQIKAVLERAFRNYYYYKYVAGYGGYDYYTRGMFTISKNCVITYLDDFPAAYDPADTHVLSLTIGGVPVDLYDSAAYYRVATLRSLAMGEVNFNDGGTSIWPLAQIAADTPLLIRNAVMAYIQSEETISPAAESRLVFLASNPNPTPSPTPTITPTPTPPPETESTLTGAPTPTPSPIPTQEITDENVPSTGESGPAGVTLLIGLVLILMSAALTFVLVRNHKT